MSEKKEDDWNFDISEEAIKEAHTSPAEEAPKKKQSAPSLLKQQQAKNLRLDTDNAPKRRNRSNAEAYIGKTGPDEMEGIPTFADRVTSIAVDFVVAGILKLPAGLFAEQTFNLVFAFSRDQLGDTGFLETENIRMVMTTLNHFALMIIVFGLMGAILKKSPGKFVSKTVVEDIDGGPAGFFRSFLRETVGKGLALVSVIGLVLVFVTGKHRGLHDYLFKTVVRKE